METLAYNYYSVCFSMPAVALLNYINPCRALFFIKVTELPYATLVFNKTLVVKGKRIELLSLRYYTVNTIW